MKEIRGRKEEGINRYKTAGQVLERVSCGNLGKWPTPVKQQRSWHSWVVAVELQCPHQMWVAVINMPVLVWGMPTCVIPGTHLCLSTLCCHQNTPALLVYFLLLSSFGEKTVKVWELDGISLCWCQNCNIELILNLKYFFFLVAFDLDLVCVLYS